MAAQGVALTLCYGGLLVYCLAVFTGLGYFPLDVLIALAVSTICQVGAMVAGAVIISLNARTMRAANVMASFIILPIVPFPCRTSCTSEVSSWMPCPASSVMSPSCAAARPGGT